MTSAIARAIFAVLVTATFALVASQALAPVFEAVNQAFTINTVLVHIPEDAQGKPTNQR